MVQQVCNLQELVAEIIIDKLERRMSGPQEHIILQLDTIK